MIDKLDLGLPRVTLLQPAVNDFIRESAAFQNSARRSSSKYYGTVVDLHPMGIDALLNLGLEFPASHEGEGKLEVFDTGTKTFSEICDHISSVIDGPIDDLKVMRIDLCADIFGVPVSWFAEKLRMKYKRLARTIAPITNERLGMAGIQTIYAGKRPNIFRVYDKIAEAKQQLKSKVRKLHLRPGELSLKELFGYSESDVLTRLESQLGGGRIPREIATFGQLRAALPAFNPFVRLEILNGTGADIPTIEQSSLDEWLKGEMLRRLHEEMGEQHFSRWLAAKSNGNAARYKRTYANYLYPDFDGKVTSDLVYQIYRQSVEKQLTG